MREEIKYIDRQIDTVLAVAYRFVILHCQARGDVCMYQPWRKKETRLIFFHHLQQPKRKMSSRLTKMWFPLAPWSCRLQNDDDVQ
ncbi:unnamed protein product [Sphagnum troendelagicum]|uniref:Uncharacterized protein n=1 Tax=Sphagnum troendelagicum TaxID=128251 RepID=A0ABP0UGS7_9BRYO